MNGQVDKFLLLPSRQPNFPSDFDDVLGTSSDGREHAKICRDSIKLSTLSEFRTFALSEDLQILPKAKTTVAGRPTAAHAATVNHHATPHVKYQVLMLDLVVGRTCYRLCTQLDLGLVDCRSPVLVTKCARSCTFRCVRASRCYITSE